MRILLAAKHAPHGSRPIGGVQSWCRTVANELTKRGHMVTTWGPEQGVPLGGFDLGIMANVNDTARAFAWCRKTLLVSHGIISAEEPQGENVVFTSEEIRDHWKGSGPVIRQPIDTAFWSPETVQRDYLTRFSYRAGLPFVITMAKAMGLSYRHVKNSSQEEARKTVRKSVCVLATGRAALEAMACDVPVVLCDHRGAYQQPLMHTVIKQAMLKNYSGRGGITPTPENVKKAVIDAVAVGGRREHIMQYHRVENIVDQLLEVAL